MSLDHAAVNETKRDAVLRLLSDLDWHAHYELAVVGGVRYSARILELKRLGYTIETRDTHSEEGKLYRLPTLTIGRPQGKRVKVFLEESDVLLMIHGVISNRARSALLDAHGSFDTNREKL